MKYGVLIVALYLVLRSTAAQSCGGANVTLAEGRGFDIQRACTLYDDLIRNHIPNATERPHVVFHLRPKLNCAKHDLASLLRGREVACVDRKRYAVDIYLSEDKPEHYVVALADVLDYANRLYLNREFIVRECSEVIAELRDPETKKHFHATVSAAELKKR